MPVLRRITGPADPGASALIASTLINTVGDGLYIAGSALFFTRGLHMPVATVGLGLTCAGLIGLTAGIPLGRLADSRGPREVLIAIQMVQAVAIASFVLVAHSILGFVLVATIFIASMQGADAAKGALVGRLAAADPVRLRAILQSVGNIGISLGTVCAGIAIASGTTLAYQSLMLGNAVSFIAAALFLILIPRTATDTVKRTTDGQRRRLVAVRNRPYLALTASNCVMALQYFVLAFAMPLWVIGHTNAPRWLVSPILLSNTAMIVALQVWFSRYAKTPERGARSMRRAGFVLAIGMVLYSAASGVDETGAVLLLLAAGVAHTVGELLQTSGAFGISYGLASEGALGEYLGVYGLGIGICRAIAPGVLAGTCLAHGETGWLFLAGLFVASGLATPALVRWAQSSRGEALPSATAHADVCAQQERFA